MVALFAALIVPWFVNWDDYKTTFEQEASRILGHPVRVVGSAKLTILPSPSLVVTRDPQAPDRPAVEIGEFGQPPLATLDGFEVTIELMPLLSGEIAVTSMRLDGPRVRLAVDEDGDIDWLDRPVRSEGLDPDKVVLSAVTVTDGILLYSDKRTGTALEFAGISAALEARSLAGPWRVDGSYIDEAGAVPFHLATGRLLEDGTIRVKSDVNLSRWPVDVAADGILGRDPEDGLSYTGTYVVTELVENVTGEAVANGGLGGPAGWRSEGAFRLTGERLAIDTAVLSHGPPEQPTSLAGSFAMDFGENAAFEAVAEARQLDLDRTFGGGPNQPVEVFAATEQLVAWLGGLPVPPLPGTVRVSVPAIVVGGSVIQDVALSASPADGGWDIASFNARFPGQASIEADGRLRTNGTVGFKGDMRLAVLQPATFASWWRGSGSGGAGRLLSAFDISGETELAPGRIAVDNVSARIGDATLTGRFAWSETPRTWHRHLGTDLRADRIDFAQLKALAELLVGRDLTDTGALADSYAVILSAGTFQYEDIRMTDVAVDAEYSNDVLKIVRFAIGDLGGSSFRVTSGRIDEPTTNLRGELTAELEAWNVDGLALIAGRFFPDSGALEWLGRTADTITPAFVRARIVAPPVPGGTGFRISVDDGAMGATAFNLHLESRGQGLSDWRDAPGEIALVLDSPDSAALARQLGFAATAAEEDTGAHVEIRGAGVPSEGIDSTVIAEFAGLTANASGKLAFDESYAPAFDGNFGLSALDLKPLTAIAGLAIPLGNGDAGLDADGTVSVSEGAVSLRWRNGQIAGRTVSGEATIGRSAERRWRLDGDLAVDDMDLGWLTGLSLGASPLPTGDAETPWPRTPFTAPTYGPLSGRVAVAVERLALGGGLSVSNGKLSLAFQPQRIDIDLTAGDFAGGSAAGGLSIHNVEGNAGVTGQFTVAGASLDGLVWRVDERAVATGIVDLSANFEATGASPAGLVTSATGGGVLSIHDGEARYIDPTQAARQIVRASDLGQEYTEDALRITLGQQLGADVLRFGEAGGAFTVAAGTFRIRGLSVSAPHKVEAAGNAVIDLNTMTIDSDWRLAFDPGDTKVQGTEPQIGVVFRGPLAAPQRTIDALPFGSYLNTRREARILEILAREEADRLEREWFARVALKLRQDTERAERLAREAEEAERLRREIAAATADRIETLHAFRDDREQALRAESLVHWAETTVAESQEAAARAVELVAYADDEHARAEALAADLASLREESARAAGEAARAGAELEALSAAADEADDRARAAGAQADAAREALEAAGANEAAAMAALSEAEAAAAAAAVRVGEGEAASAAAAAERTEAESELDLATRALQEMDHALSAAVGGREAATEALGAAESALAEAEARAAEAGATRAAAAAEATAAAEEARRLQGRAQLTEGLAVDAARALEAAEEALAAAEADLVAAEAAFAEAASLVAGVRAGYEALSNDPGAIVEQIDAAEAMLNAMRLREASRKADVDRLRQVVEGARGDVDEAEEAATSTASAARAAASASDAAAATSTAATTSAERANAVNAALLNAVSDASDAKAASALRADDTEAAAQKAGEAFQEAQGWVEVATMRASTAAEADNAAAQSLAEARTEAAEAAETVEAGRAALSSATSAREAAASDLDAAETAAAEALAAAEIAAEARRMAEENHRQAADAASAASAALAEAEAAYASARAEAAAADAVARASADRAASLAVVAERARTHLAPGAVDEAIAVPVLRPRTQPISLVPGGSDPLMISPVQ